MKQIMIFILLFVITSSVSLAIAQEQSGKTALEQAVYQLDNARTPDEWKQARNLFERLSLADPSAWLPGYYLAYTDIELSFRTNEVQQKQYYLKEASDCLEKLKKMKMNDPKERSEVSTLRGYWYFAQMAIDPAQNGPKYAGIVTNLYGEALKLNPENPRAIYLNAVFQHSMASFMGGTYEKLNDDIQRAMKLFKVQTKDNTSPHWEVKINP